eukprot:334914-Amphidinium_carterae.3
MHVIGLQASQINHVLNYFDENGIKYFQRPNLRPMTDLARQQQLERLRPQPVHQHRVQDVTHTPHYSDITSEEDEDNYDDYDET